MSTEPPDLSGKVAMVTGSNTGIGKEIARGIARTGARVVLACRDEEKGHAALDEIAEETDNHQLDVMTVDLSCRASIRQLARDFHERHSRLHILVNNAGIYPDSRELSAEGVEMTWATNVVAYHLLTTLLLDVIRASAPARIVNIASHFAGNLDLDDPQFESRAFNGSLAYRQSKQANRMLSWELAKRLEGTGVTVNVEHPGPVDTELPRSQSGPLGWFLRAGFRLFGRSPRVGADTAVWLATAPELEGVTGKYWFRRREVPCKFRDAAAQKRLWEQVERLSTAPVTASGGAP